MRRIVLLSLICASISLGITFERNYGNGNKSTDVGRSVVQTRDGGYIIGGYTNDSNNNDIYLIKTDSLGEILWTRVYADTTLLYEEECYSVDDLDDGGYIVAGRKSGNIYLIRTDSLGDTLWTRIYGYGAAYSVEETRDGAYIVAGDVFLEGQSYSNILLMKVDSSGDTLWTRTYILTSYIDYATSVKETRDGGYVLVGSLGDNLLLLMKTDSLGDTLWTRIYGDTTFSLYKEVGYSVDELDDGGYIVGGSKSSSIYLMRTDSLGDTLWTRVYEDGVAYSVEETEDGAYIVTGVILDDKYGKLFLMKVDSSGNVIWTRIYGGDLGTAGYSLDQTRDKGYVVTGSIFLEDEINNVYLIKTDSLGLLGVRENEYDLATSFSIKTSIFYLSVIMSYHIKKATKISIKIHNIQGRVIKTLVDEYRRPGTYRIEWDGRDEYGREVSPGVYFCTFEADGLKDTKKIIRLK